MNDFEIKSGDSDSVRQAYRTRVPGFEVRFPGDGRVLAVKDLSATGFALLDENHGFRENERHEAEFLLNKKLFLGGLQALVIRVAPNGVVGFNFEDLDRRQILKLDKLVLEVQKRLIQLRKAKAEE